MAPATRASSRARRPWDFDRFPLSLSLTSNLNPQLIPPMLSLILIAAAGYSLVYLLLGGGFGGAVVIFIVAKLLGK